MDPDLPRSSSPRKVKFAPKTRKRRLVPKREVEAVSDDDEETNSALLRKIKDNLTRGRPQANKKSSVRVAFADGVASAGVANEGYSGIKRAGIASKVSSANTCQDVVSLPTESSQYAAGPSLSNTKKKEYKEPWDYEHSYYPITLPLRRPGSGDPELLDEEEFGGKGEVPDYDESTLNSASYLGLTEEDADARTMFFKVPSDLPFGHRRSSAAQKEASMLFRLPGNASNGSDAKQKIPSKVSGSAKGKETGVSSVDIHEFPPAYMGKMLVYKSGAVKMKLGDVLYDVSPGVDCTFAQDVAVMNTRDRECCVLGGMSKMATVTPEFDSICNALDRLNRL